MQKPDSDAHAMNPESVALVTAGASGIGRCVAEKLAAHGCRIHICDIDQNAIDEFLLANPDASGTRADVSSADDVDRVFADLEAKYGRLDVLVNNAGVAGPTAAVEDIDPKDWDRTLAIDLNSVFYCARKAVPLLKKNGGSMINMSSTAGVHGCPGRAPYVAAKWAIIGLTKTLAMELGEAGIRVNAICPGSVEGERIDRVVARDAKRQGKSEDEIRDIYHRQTSMRTFIEADDVANMVMFLASSTGRFVSGQALGVDGHTETLGHWAED